MIDLLKQLLTDHGLAAVIGIASIVATFWWAARILDALSEQNKATTAQNAAIARLDKSISKLLDRNGIDSEPPPEPPPDERKRARGLSRLMPRMPTLPALPAIDAVPEPVEPEKSVPPPRRRHRGI